MSTWLNLITGIIEEYGRPMNRTEIREGLSEHFKPIDNRYLGVILSDAKKLKQIGYIKILEKKPGYYCNPNWLDEDGKLKKQYNYNPLWAKNQNGKITPNKNQST